MYIKCVLLLVFLSSKHVDRRKQKQSEFGKLQLSDGHIVN